MEKDKSIIDPLNNKIDRICCLYFCKDNKRIRKAEKFLKENKLLLDNKNIIKKDNEYILIYQFKTFGFKVHISTINNNVTLYGFNNKKLGKYCIKPSVGLNWILVKLTKIFINEYLYVLDNYRPDIVLFILERLKYYIEDDVEYYEKYSKISERLNKDILSLQS